jgi:hypothetical protein
MTLLGLCPGHPLYPSLHRMQRYRLLLPRLLNSTTRYCFTIALRSTNTNRTSLQPTIQRKASTTAGSSTAITNCGISSFGSNGATHLCIQDRQAQHVPAEHRRGLRYQQRDFSCPMMVTKKLNPAVGVCCSLSRLLQHFDLAPPDVFVTERAPRDWMRSRDYTRTSNTVSLARQDVLANTRTICNHVRNPDGNVPWFLDSPKPWQLANVDSKTDTACNAHQLLGFASNE